MYAKVNHSETVYKGRVFKMVRENITLSKGSTFNIDIIHHPGAAAIVPLSDSNKVVLIYQYRHAVGGCLWEIPAGTLDGNEDPIECAKRELIEETGYSANQWDKLGEIVPVPGYSSERIHLFLARKLIPATQNLGKDEMLDVHEIDFDEVIRRIRSGEIQDGKSIAGLMLAYDRIK